MPPQVPACYRDYCQGNSDAPIHPEVLGDDPSLWLRVRGWGEIEELHAEQRLLAISINTIEEIALLQTCRYECCG